MGQLIARARQVFCFAAIISVYPICLALLVVRVVSLSALRRICRQNLGSGDDLARPSDWRDIGNFPDRCRGSNVAG